MAGNGPLPTPTAILKARGSWRAKSRKREPKISGEIAAPSWLSSEARKEWVRLVDLLAPAGVLKATDRDALAGYCELVVEYAAVNKSIRSLTEKKLAGAKRRRDVLYDRMLKAAPHFGLTPATRTRVNATETNGNSHSNKAKYFRAG